MAADRYLTRVEIKPDEPLYKALREMIAAEETLVLEVQEGYELSEYVVGDRVRVAFDDGMGPATVTAVGEFITVKYGPGGKYSTSLGRGSVQTDRKRSWPATIRTTAP